MTPIVDLIIAGRPTMGWLCPACQATYRAAGDTVTETGKLADRPCDDCETKGTSETPAYVLTPADAPPHRPGPNWKREAPPEPWPVYMKRKAAELAAEKATKAKTERAA